MLRTYKEYNAMENILLLEHSIVETSETKQIICLTCTSSPIFHPFNFFLGLHCYDSEKNNCLVSTALLTFLEDLQKSSHKCLPWSDEIGWGILANILFTYIIGIVILLLFLYFLEGNIDM